MSLQSRILIALIRLLHPLPGTDWAPERQRRMLERFAYLADRPRDIKVQPVEAAGMPALWLTPKDAVAGRVILYLHGGAYLVGSLRTHREIASYVARYSQARVLLIQYRLAPEHPFPAALEDALAAYRWLRSQGCAPEELALAGDSAGGGLSMATLLALRDAGEALPAAAVLISPWADLLCAGESVQTRRRRDPLFRPDDLPAAAKHYLNGYDAHNPLISPVYARFHGLPPTLIQVGDEELLLSDATRLAEGMRRDGSQAELSIWPGQWHVFHAAGMRMPESKKAFQEIGQFLRKHFSLSRQGVYTKIVEEEA
jgi:epsilon-lactone hydrolase